MVGSTSSWSSKQTDDDGLGRKGSQAITKVKPQVEQWNLEKKRVGGKVIQREAYFEMRSSQTTNPIILFVLPHQELPLKVPFSEFSPSSTGP